MVIMIAMRAVHVTVIPVRRRRRIAMRVPGVRAARGMRRIRAAFGFERRLLLADDEVHLAQHLCQHVIGLELQPVRLEFDVAPPASTVPGEWWALVRVAAAGELLYTPAVRVVVR